MIVNDLFEIMSPKQRLLRNRLKQDKEKWREKQKNRFNKEQDWEGRHTPKSQVSYKPFKTPLIRFGKFRERSKIYLDAEFRQEMGNPTHEAGVSVYEAISFKDGFYVIPPDPFKSVYYCTDSFALLEKFKNQIINYIKNNTPIDIFLIYGHLCSFGKQNEWLSLGSDGEFLLDIKQPYKMTVLKPEQLYMTERPPLNLLQWFEKRFGLKDVNEY
jgi:hypothetical protein